MLLILAVVAIGAVQNDGIIEYAKNARDQYRLAQDEESSILGNYLSMLNKNNGNGAGGNENGTEAMSYHIGDIVTVAGEMFYVLKDCPETQNNVVLLSYGTLYVEGENMVQSNSATTMTYSDAVTNASQYGVTLGGTGRLMKYNEANALISTEYNAMILNGNDKMAGSYWLEPSAESASDCCVCFHDITRGDMRYSGES